MWSLIIVVVLFIVAIVGLSDEVDSKIIGWIAFILFGTGLTFCWVFASRVPLATVSQSSRTDIVALSNSTQIHGLYFLIAGSIDQSPVYYYFEKTADGGYIQHNISADNVVIYQDTMSDGYILNTVVKEVPQADYFKRYNGWVWMVSPYSVIYKTEIHVPPNTIIQQFNLDLSKQ